MEVLTKEETIQLIKQFYVPPLLGRRDAAQFLGMGLPSFDKFIAKNPHLKRRAPGSAPRYCPLELREVFGKF